MDLLKTILIYMSMVFVSSVQNAPEPTVAPVVAATVPPALIASATPTATPTPKPSAVPTPDITPNKEYKTIKVGDNGEGVTNMQRRLAELGYYEGEIDGRFGNQTRRAVERFQYNNGLSADGIAGKNTLTVLYESKNVVAETADEETTPSPAANARTSPPPAAQTPTVKPDATTPEPTFIPTVAPALSDSLKAAEEDTQADAPVASPGDENEEPGDTLEPEGSVQPEDGVEPEPQEIEEAEEGQALALMEEYGFMLAGKEELLASNVQGDAEPEPLKPLLKDEEMVLIPLLDILRSANILVLPTVVDQHAEVAFALGSDLFLLAYDLDEDGNPQEIVIAKNGQPEVMARRVVIIEDGRVYLPLEEMEKWTGLTYVLDEESKVYTVTIPQEEG